MIPVAGVDGADGTVLRLFSSERGGITLHHLALDGHTLYYYAHLDRYADGMAAGRALRKGEVIAYVGDSGNAARRDRRTLSFTARRPSE